MKPRYVVPPDARYPRDEGITRGQLAKVIVMLACCFALVVLLVLAAKGLR